MKKVEIVPAEEIRVRVAEWQANRPTIKIEGREADFIAMIEALVEYPQLKGKHYTKVMRRFAGNGLPWLSKSQVLQVYHDLCAKGLMTVDDEIRTRLQMKPVRSQAGVTVVTVLTKPYPCPGKCIFCPTDVRMPKSYLHDEPGAQRAERHAFDPFDQTASRIDALEQIGHPVDKIELIVLGGTWSSYKRDYQEWFIKRCFDAMNGIELPTLAEAQAYNVTCKRRNVGLVVETRQDYIDVDELRWFRHLGVTKVQVGIQSMDERVLALNNRGHDVDSTRQAFRLLRLAGFKIHGHWMSNLLGGTPDGDVADYGLLWSDKSIRPDELKLYPCMLLENAELHEYWERGEYRPYTEDEALDVLIRCKRQTPPYVRLTRIIRDIPTDNVVEGMTKANLRQMAQQKMTKMGEKCACIRCREVKRTSVTPDELSFVQHSYETDATMEHFLSYETDDGRLAGFLRLSFPDQSIELPLPELKGHAMIREVHVYGPVVSIGEENEGDAQHTGLGSRLVARAKEMSIAAGYEKIAVISAVGTQDYYAKHHGFAVDGLYMTMQL